MKISKTAQFIFIIIFFSISFSYANSDNNSLDYDFYSNSIRPKIIKNPRIVYPLKARRMGIEADIKVNVTITKYGNVKEVLILDVRLYKTNSISDVQKENIMQGFMKNAHKALMKAKFTIPKCSGKPCSLEVNLPLKFRLHN